VANKQFITVSEVTGDGWDDEGNTFTGRLNIDRCFAVCCPQGPGLGLRFNHRRSPGGLRPIESEVVAARLGELIKIYFFLSE